MDHLKINLLFGGVARGATEALPLPKKIKTFNFQFSPGR